MARASYEAGLRDVGSGLYAYLQPHGGWGLSNAGLERIVANVAACYRELADEQQRDDIVELFGAMARWERARRL